MLTDLAEQAHHLAMVIDAGGSVGFGISGVFLATSRATLLRGCGWLLSGIGDGYASLGEFSEAEKSFTQLKEKAEGEFWPKVADYFLAKSSDRGNYDIPNE